MSVEVLEAGLLDTIQDAGRYGFSSLGINPGGVMDKVAAAAANFLVGNDEAEAVIEFHFPAGKYQINKTSIIAITGADFSAVINDAPVPVNTAIIAPADAILEFRKLKNGARAYLAVQGGFQVEKWLNSYSTNIKAKAGGIKGERLKKGDIIQLNHHLNTDQFLMLPWHADVDACYQSENTIRIIKGSEYQLLTECSETIVDGNSFCISTQSDRMGYRLSGSPLQIDQTVQMISAPVTRGTIQLLPNGQLIILMADHQTTGGYPKIAHVIGTDISRLAQMQVNTSIRFKTISIDEAETLLIQQHHHLQQLKNACNFRLNEFLEQHALY